MSYIILFFYEKILTIIVKNEIHVKRINEFSRIAELGIPLLHGGGVKSLYGGSSGKTWYEKLPPAPKNRKRLALL
jgi:hypothetical protein